MADMVGDMDDMGGMGHGGMSGVDHGAMSGMNHGGMPSMNHSDIQMMDDTGTTMIDPGGMQTMNHSQRTESGGVANSLKVPNETAQYARTEYGPSTDMHADIARINLDNSGVGLRNNERRILALADVYTIDGPMDKRGSEREVELHLIGNMGRCTWSFDGAEFGKSIPVHPRYGERLRVTLHNDVVMTHPTHLHGMWSELEAPDGTFLTHRHTIPIQPAQRIGFLVTANTLGRWA